MPDKIIIVRHGLTRYNVERRMQGWLDIPLNREGRIQARAVARRLQSESIDVIYSSDHRRALLTAKHIASFHGLKPKTSRALRERRMGIFEGWQWENEQDQVRNAFWQKREQALAERNYDWKAEGEESMNEHFQRVHRHMNRLELRHNTGTILIVSHGATINRILEHYQVREMHDSYISFGNTAVTILEKVGDVYQATVLNDTSHVEGL